MLFAHLLPVVLAQALFVVHQEFLRGLQMSHAGGIAESIERRSREVRCPGEWMFFFEWAVWASKENVSVHLLFGSSIVDVLGVFAPKLRSAFVRETHRVAAVRIDAEGTLLSATRQNGHRPDVNHFVIGCPIMGRQEPEAIDDVPNVLRPQASCARLVARSIGWILKCTAAQGDCAVDCMVYHRGEERNAKSWAKIRQELADEMLRVRHEHLWHDAFITCQEMDDTAYIPKHVGKIVGGMGPPMVDDKLQAVHKDNQLASASNKTASGSSGSSSCQVASCQAASGQAASRLGASDQKIEEQQPKECASPKMLPNDLEYFQDWLRKQSQEEQQRITSSYFRYAEAEEKWLADHPRVRASLAVQGPRRAYRSTHLRLQRAVGMQYLAWLAEQGFRLPKRMVRP